MKFVKTTRHGPFQDTSRKRAALARKQRLEREKFPLFSVEIAEQQKDADTVMEERAVKWAIWQQDHRDRKAALWRKARRRLFSYGDNVRPRLRDLWNSCPYPKNPDYLLDFLHDFSVGRMDLDNPPWIYRGPGLKAFDLAPILARAKARQEALRSRPPCPPEPFFLTSP
ncbi:hypothetical protein HW571_22600 [Agrobacterium genomosp. 3]|uniref:hypothetical protein n=1 Tax=Agrobacterium tomkonis TaxID=1183410 RepID=UPI001CD8F728|nr:hypothetical protein [Agrobacterium tomkonis]MCA1878887.1 hypothetical protein [Agrobacterium tumefaciens]MCA1894120.1 hypothetical protein [Agrobacterium tomkonis]